jgi:hypothetical protein
MLIIFILNRFVYLFYGCTIILNSLDDTTQTAWSPYSAFIDFYTVLCITE